MGYSILQGITYRRITIFFLAILGLLATIKLSIIYFDANFNPYALPSFCSVNSTIDCDGVAQTGFSQAFGIPLALWGAAFYMFVILLLFVNKLKNFKYLSFLSVFKKPLSYISALGYIAFVISMILACISIFVIKKICVLCVVTYFIDFIIAILATDFKNGFFYNIKISYQDFIDALKEKKYLITFIALLALTVCVLTYTTATNILTPQVKRINEYKKYKKLTKNNPFKTRGNSLGNEDAKLIVYIYTDYKCPICQTYNIILSRAANELDNIKFIHKNYPLDAKCNRTVESTFHEGSCILSQYAIASEKQGKFWDMNSELFENQPKNENEVIKIAQKLGMNIEKLKLDAKSEQTMKKLKDDIEDGINIELIGTPAIVINGKIYSGIKPYYELKDLLIKAGAIEKQ